MKQNQGKGFFTTQPEGIHEINRRIDTILGSISAAARQARGWALLWELYEPSPSEGIERDPVMKACQHMIRHLKESLTITEVARNSGLSHNQFVRRFRTATGTTPAAWLRRERIAYATDLLQHSDLAIQAVGAEVGYPDPQHFNKVMRQETNRSPIMWRNS